MNSIKIKQFELTRHKDNRGYLEEVFKANMLPDENQDFGQCFLTTAHPGIVKGNHWHKKKYELFYLVKGQATVYFKDLDTQDTLEIQMSEDLPKVVQIPPKYLHAIKNTGTEEFYLMIYTDKASMECDIDDMDTSYVKWIE